MSTHSCGILVKLRAHLPWYPPRSPSQTAAIYSMHHLPFLPDIQTSFCLKIVLYDFIPPLPQQTHWVTTSLIEYLHPLNIPVILSSLHMAEPPENTCINPFIIPHNSFIRALETLSILLILSKLLRLSICITLILLSYHYLTTIHKDRHEHFLIKDSSTLKLQIPSITRDLIEPAALLPLSTLLRHCFICTWFI